MEKTWPFDSEATRDYTKARQAVLREALTELRKKMRLETALDIGCGVGYFAKFLLDEGLQVTGVDGRAENTAEGKARYPEITFLVRNAEDEKLSELGRFDVVLCVGLLYHLENPFRTIRSLRAMTGKVLLAEAMCAPGNDASMKLVDENDGEDQGLNYVAFYPTEACLAKMLYRAGFRRVYGFRNLPRHPLFHSGWWHRKQRTMLLACDEEQNWNGLELIADVRGSWETLASPREKWKSRLDRWTRPWKTFAPQSSQARELHKAK